jgi:hypothetical protein
MLKLVEEATVEHLERKDARELSLVETLERSGCRRTEISSMMSTSVFLHLSIALRFACLTPFFSPGWAALPIIFSINIRSLSCPSPTPAQEWRVLPEKLEAATPVEAVRAVAVSRKESSAMICRRRKVLPVPAEPVKKIWKGKGWRGRWREKKTRGQMQRFKGKPKGEVGGDWTYRFSTNHSLEDVPLLLT